MYDFDTEPIKVISAPEITEYNIYIGMFPEGFIQRTENITRQLSKRELQRLSQPVLPGMLETE